MKKAVFTTAALAIGAGLVGGSAVAASAATGDSGISTSPLGSRLISPTKVTPAVVPAADTVTRLARDGGIAQGSAFERNKAGGMSGIYLDGMDPNAAKKPTIPVRNPAGSGSVQVRPLNAPTTGGLGTLLPNK
ncbi:hypothetical protein [Streptomyces sp. NPDC098781]|uniref:hypothetical protein n=1 Tax=Streptomyces sp. NPDC098781 TaxID=3366097 RepID=UPI003816F246